MRFLPTLKASLEQVAVQYARQHLAFQFQFVLYDVTTLYFEAFEPDEDIVTPAGITLTGFRKKGFSKDHKNQQPQIVLGLLVTPQGYPLAFDWFEGNTFEGHTLIPAIKRLQAAYGIEQLTVVADAGMLSLKNTETLKAAKLTYIVGARVANLSPKLIQEIASFLDKTESKHFVRITPRGQLICDYSVKRALKDKRDRDRQIKQAEYQIKHPDKITKRSRLVKEATKTQYSLNQDLIEKDKLREGIKGYYTNLEDVEPKAIIAHYKQLWQVEHSFRMTKSDLMARPIYHQKRESIEAHLLIVFVSLCISKSIELESKESIQRIKGLIWQIEDIEFEDELTGETYTKRMERAPTGIPVVDNFLGKTPKSANTY